jgi:flagellar M-ring protein FliF
MKIITVVNFLKNMEFTKLMTLIGTFIAAIILFTILIFKYTAHDYIPLYSNLEIEDSNRIIAMLEQMDVKYELKAGGTQILVEEDRVLRLRMQLAQEGIPSKGNVVGYEIFDKSDSITASNFVQNVNLMRALEGELSRTISSFNNIRTCRVHLVLPKKDLFSKEQKLPTASIVIEMNSAIVLTKDETNAIAHLVATAVPGLDPKMITIVDTRGRPIKTGESDDDDSSFSNRATDYKIEYEKKLKKTIENLLEKIVGTGGVEAQISADINFDRLVTNSEIYDPDGQVVRSTQTTKENDKSSENSLPLGDASVLNNIPNDDSENSNNIQTKNSTNKTDELVNYEISKTIKNFISETGIVKRLSIAVLVDGVYNKNLQSNTETYQPRTEKELEQYTKLVKSAVGFDATRGDNIVVENLQFQNIFNNDVKEESFVDIIKQKIETDLFYIIKITLSAIIGLTVLIAFIKPFINKIFDSASANIQAQIDAEVAIARAEVKHANIKSQENKESRSVIVDKEVQEHISIKKNHTFKTINDVVDQCPQETIMVLRNWLNEQ